MNLYYNGYLDEIEDRIKDFREERKNYKKNNLKFLILGDRDSLKNLTCQELFSNTIEPYMKAGLKPKDMV